MQKNSLTRPALGAAMLVAATATSAALASESDGNNDLQRQIAELRAEVAKLRGQDNEHWLTQQRADEVRSIVHEVLADADTRASLLGSGMTAGYDRGFYLASADGNYRLNITGRHQFRYVYNFQSDPVEFDGDRHRNGFENRRTRLAFSGHVINPNWTYQIQGDFSRSGGGFTLLDANLAYRFDNGMRIRVGQFRQPFMREDNISSGRQQAIERSLVNARFSQGRTQGIELSGSITDNINFSTTFSEGFRRLNTPWQAETTEYAFTGKLDFLVAGNWRQFRDFSSWASEEFGVLLGVAAHYERGEYGTATASMERFTATADAMVQFGGANLFGAVVMNHLDMEGAGNMTQWGVVVQGGFFFVPDKWEAFARYEWGDLDTGAEDLSVVTAGVNYYFAGHNLKWQTDIGYGINEVASPWASSSAGWRADAPGEDGQVVFRSQIQWIF